MPGEIEIKVYALGAIEKMPEGIYIFLVVLLCIGSLFLFWLKGLREGGRYTMLLLLAEWVFLVFGTCLIFRESDAESRINLTPFSSYFDYGENTYLMETSVINILNMLMFIPVGLLSAIGFKEMTWKKSILFGLSLSILIELLQFILKKGLCETDDVIHNLVGCMIGYAIYRFSASMVKKIKSIYQTIIHI